MDVPQGVTVVRPRLALVTPVETPARKPFGPVVYKTKGIMLVSEEQEKA